MEATDPKVENSDLQNWFNDLIAQLRLDQSLHQMDQLDDSKQTLYEQLSNQNAQEVARQLVSQYNQGLIGACVALFLTYLKKNNSLSSISKLSFDFSNTRVLAWIELKEDSYEVEHLIFEAEGQTNASLSKEHVSIDCTIVYSDDLLEAPDHFQKYM